MHQHFCNSLLYVPLDFQTFDTLLKSTQPGNGGRIGLYFTDTEIIPVGIKGCFRFDKDDNQVVFGLPNAFARCCVSQIFHLSLT